MIVEVNRGRVARLVLLVERADPRVRVFGEVVMRDGSDSTAFSLVNGWLVEWVRANASPIPEKVVLDVLSQQMPRSMWRWLMALLNGSSRERGSP